MQEFQRQEARKADYSIYACFLSLALDRRRFMSVVSWAERKKAAACCLLLLAAGIVLLLLRNAITAFAHSDAFPDCTFRRLTGWLCPACGNTRAGLEILHGHFFRAFGYNPMMPLVVLVLGLLYGETVLTAFGKRVRLFPRSNLLLFTGIGIVLVYDVVRNFFPEITLCL